MIFLFLMQIVIQFTKMEKEFKKHFTTVVQGWDSIPYFLIGHFDVSYSNMLRCGVLL